MGYHLSLEPLPINSLIFILGIVHNGFVYGWLRWQGLS